MVFAIRNYKPSDYSMLASWWSAGNMPVPTKSAVPPTTYIVEMDGQPIVSCALILTNISSYCFIDFLVGNPAITGQNRKFATSLVIEYCFAEAKRIGYENIVAISVKDKLTKYYEQFGMRETWTNASTMSREL